MIKKIVLIVLLLTANPITVNAGFWDDVGACFTDPCNCGDSTQREERWGGYNPDGTRNDTIIYRTVDRNNVCPPWNKGGGRNDHTCLLKNPYPETFIGYYENLCGEATRESTYLEPKIRVRGQQCNFAACWTTDHTLAWDGQCVTLASGYGIPLLRVCARVAIPANYKANFPQDYGYTEKVHLDTQGQTIPDKIPKGYDGQFVDFNPPKLCLYKDPAFLSFKDGFDLMDLDPNKQSAHKTTEVHPVVKVMIFLVDMVVEANKAPYQLLGALVGLIAGNDSSGQTTFASVLKDLFSFIGWIIEKIGDTVISILKAIGQINRSVEGSYGCVELPLGPFPPPFCPTLKPFFQTAYTQRICRKDSDGKILPSVKNELCVVSELENNFVKNSIRITFENFVPLCQGSALATSDKCVVIENLGNFSSASQLHNGTGNTDIIPVCEQGVTTPCVRTIIKPPIPASEKCTGNCKGSFRVVYGLSMGTLLLLLMLLLRQFIPLFLRSLILTAK